MLTFPEIVNGVCPESSTCKVPPAIPPVEKLLKVTFDDEPFAFKRISLSFSAISPKTVLLAAIILEAKPVLH